MPEADIRPVTTTEASHQTAASTRSGLMSRRTSSELPPESLHPGDTIEYYFRGFVCGDPRGLRVAVILGIDATPDQDFPLALDTGKLFATPDQDFPLALATGMLLPLATTMKRSADRFGNRFKRGFTWWRTVRSYHLFSGRWNAPTRASAFHDALPDAIRAAVDATMLQLRSAREESNDNALQRYLREETSDERDLSVRLLGAAPAQ